MRVAVARMRRSGMRALGMLGRARDYGSIGVGGLANGRVL